jgi:hypothetical protein
MTRTKSREFRTIIFHGVNAHPALPITFPTWKAADRELARLTEYAHITGGHIEQYVPGLGWVVCDDDPDAE